MGNNENVNQSKMKWTKCEILNAENDVEYAELSMALQPPAGRVTFSHRPWDPSSESLDEHVMLFHLFELQDRQTAPGTCQGNSWRTPGSNYKNSSAAGKKPRKSFIDTLQFNLGALGASNATTEEPNPLDMLSASCAPVLRTNPSSLRPQGVSACSTTTEVPNNLDTSSTPCSPILRMSQSSLHPQVVSACSTTTEDPNPLEVPSTSSVPILRSSQSSVHPKASMRKVLTSKYRPREDLHLPSRGSNKDSDNQWSGRTSPLPTNAQDDICPLEMLLQSINFETSTPLTEPSRDGSSAFSWTPFLLANRQDEPGSSNDRKKTTRSPRPKSS